MSYQPAPTNFEPVVAGQPTAYSQIPQQQQVQQPYPQQQYQQQQYPQQQFPQQQQGLQQPPNQQYYQPQPQYQQTVYVPPQQQQVVSSVVFTSGPAVVVPSNNVCSFCRAQYILVTQRRIGTLAICMSILMVFIFWPCFWLPYVMDGCKDEVMLCSACGHEIGHRSAC